MRIWKILRASGVALIVGACGGGGSGGGGAASPPSTTPTVPAGPATLNVTLLPASRELAVPEDTRVTEVVFEAQVSGTATTTVVPDIAFDPAHLATKDGVTSVGGNYRVSLSTLANMPRDASGQVTFRLCQDTACAAVYPGSTKVFSYTSRLQLLDWVTYQRDAQRTGHVPLTVNPARFSKMWEWSVPTPYMIGVATSGDQIYLTSVEASWGTYPTRLHVLNALDGTLKWSFDFGEAHEIGAPTVVGDKVFVTTNVGAAGVPISTTTGYFWCLDRTTPTVLCKFPVTDGVVSPAPAGDRVLRVGGGSPNARLVGVSIATGALTYDSPMGHVMSLNSGVAVAPAGDRAYVYSGIGLQVWNTKIGALEFAIPDPGYDPTLVQTSYASTPVVTSTGDVVALSGPGHGGGLSFLGTTFGHGRSLVSYDIDNRAVRWRTATRYLAAPVAANSVLYVTGYDFRRLSALDERTGKVLWQWEPPLPIFNAPYPVSYFMGPVLALDNIVMVSTHDRIYAVDTTTHQAVWSYDRPGIMAVTRDGVLLILEAHFDSISGVLRSNGKIVAIKMN